MISVEKLREQAHYWSTGGIESRGVADNYRDVADEIERLRTAAATSNSR